MSRSIVVTGLGAVAPNGVGVPAFAAALRAGRSGVRWLTDWERGVGDGPGERDTGRVQSRVAGVLHDWNAAAVVGAADAKRLPRCVPMAIAAAREAAWRAGLLAGGDDRQPIANGDALAARRIGVILGTGAGGIDFTLDQARKAYPAADPGAAGRNSISLWTITNATHGNLAGEVSIALGARGPSLCMSDGCASASDAVGQAMELLRSGRPGAPDAMIVVGADAHVRWETLLGMELLGVISTRDPAADGWNPAEISRPFDARRDGFVLGEGAWAAVLETPEHAAARGAADRAVATLDGYGVTCDAYHRVRPDPAMTESVRAMRHGLADASADASDIDVLHYHGTATPMNDIVETHAVRCAFGDHADRLRGHSVKALIGHPQGASGLASLVATLAGLRAADGWQDSTPATDAAPGPASGAAEPFNVPTVNLDDPGDGCDLDYTPHAPAPARGDERFMINCLAFGAKNSVLVGRAGPPA